MALTKDSGKCYYGPILYLVTHIINEHFQKLSRSLHADGRSEGFDLPPRQFPLEELEHGEDRVRPLQPISAQYSAPGTNQESVFRITCSRELAHVLVTAVVSSLMTLKV